MCFIDTVWTSLTVHTTTPTYRKHVLLSDCTGHIMCSFGALSGLTYLLGNQPDCIICKSSAQNMAFSTHLDSYLILVKSGSPSYPG